MRTELPEKWCIQTTLENCKVLSKWRTDAEISGSSIGGWLMYPGYMDKIGYNVTSKPDVEEITFEEFEILVLKIKPREPQYEIY